LTIQVNEDNIQSIVDQLLAHLAPPENSASALPSAAASLAALSNTGTTAAQDPSTTSASLSLSPAYRLLLVQRILSIISYDTYSHITDFEWVVSVLVDVAYVSNVNVGPRIRELLLDVVGRVRSVRHFAVPVLEKALNDEGLRERAKDKSGEDGLIEAAVWICAEYADNLTSPLTVISAILAPELQSATTSLSALSVHAAAKIFGHYAAGASASWSSDQHEELKSLVVSVKSGISPLVSRTDIEVQERAFELLQLLNFVEADLRNHVPAKQKMPASEMPEIEGGFEAEQSTGDNPPYPKSLFLLQPLFTGHEMNAVAAQAQSAVRLPEGLDLDRDFVPGGGFPTDLERDENDESEDEKGLDLGTGGGKGMEELRRVLREQDAEEKRKGKKSKGKGKKADGEVLSPEERAEKDRVSDECDLNSYMFLKQQRRAARRQKAKDDPYYLYDEKDTRADEDVDDIPIVKLEDDELPPDGTSTLLCVLYTDGEDSVEEPRSRKKSAKKPKPPADLDRSGEMPADARRPAEAVPEEVVTKSGGLAGVDLLADGPTSSRTSSTGRFQEYKVEGEEEKLNVDTPAVSEGIEVVRVKRKKKKDGEKKKREIV